MNQYASHQYATLYVKNPKMQFVKSNVKNLYVKLNALIKHVKLKTAQNVLQFVNNQFVKHIVK